MTKQKSNSSRIEIVSHPLHRSIDRKVIFYLILWPNFVILFHLVYVTHRTYRNAVLHIDGYSILHCMQCVRQDKIIVHFNNVCKCLNSQSKGTNNNWNVAQHTHTHTQNAQWNRTEQLKLLHQICWRCFSAWVLMLITHTHIWKNQMSNNQRERRRRDKKKWQDNILWFYCTLFPLQPTHSSSTIRSIRLQGFYIIDVSQLIQFYPSLVDLVAFPFSFSSDAKVASSSFLHVVHFIAHIINKTVDCWLSSPIELNNFRLMKFN